MNTDSQIETYIAKHEKFSGMLMALREIIREKPFVETIKWGQPTYVYQEKNLLGIGAFKNHVALWFFQGALLKDPDKILTNAQEGKTRAMRQIHFKQLSDIRTREEIIGRYLQETIENQNKGLVVPAKKVAKKAVLPTELIHYLESNTEVATSFYKLTPGRQNEYGNFIREAKREQTKRARLQKITPLIRAGKGLYDQYKNC